MDIQPGHVVEFEDSAGQRLGVVVEVGKALTLALSDATQRKVSTKAVTWPRVGQVGSLGAASALLATLERDLDARAAEANLEELWELLTLEEEADVALEDMSDLLLGDAEPEALYLTYRLLRADAVYFKAKRDAYSPRPSAQVEQLKVQAARRAEAEQTRGAFFDRVGRLAMSDAAPGAKRAELERLCADDDAFRGMLELVEEYAITGDEYARRSQANSLIDELDERASGKLRLRGSGAARAFDLLVQAGRLSPYENVWLRRSRLPVGFEPEIEAAVEALIQQLPYLDADRLDAVEGLDAWPEAAGRRDLTGLEIITIDDASTRDIDDGLSLRRLPGGGFELGVHIADPAAIVPLDSALDREARRRGTSVYAPVLTLPMFPPRLSEGAMSLVEGRIRPALSFLITLDAGYEPQDLELCLSWVCVAARVSYDEADLAIWGEQPHVHATTLDGLLQIAEQLTHKRLQQGAVVLQLPDVKIHIEGLVEGATVHRLDRIDLQVADRVSPSRDLVQEMMVLTGHEVGKLAQRLGLPLLYRAQPAPDQPEDEALMAGSVFDLVESFTMRRKMKRSTFSTTADPHFGLGLDVYTQVTSPIRRYADLVAHHQLRALARGAAPPLTRDALDEVLVGIDGLMGEAATVERESKRFWTLTALAGQRGATVGATLVGLIGDRGDRGVVCLDGTDLFVNLALTEALDPGARLAVRIEAIDARADRIALKMLGVEPASP